MPIEFKNLPDKEAIKYFKSKGYTFGFDWRDVSAQTHAHAFTVAKVTRLDILQDIRTAMDDAIKKGLTPQQFKKNLAPILQAKGWWGRKEMMDPLTGEIKKVQLGSHRRLKTIFDTNMRTSHAAGKWERIQRTKANRPYLRYATVQDGKTRPEHQAWHGTVLPIDHIFWTTHYAPNGWRCRCWVQQLSDRDLKRYDYELSNEPLIQTRGHVNKRTGEILDVPKGIDPGFANNVGLSAMQSPIDPARYTMPALGHESARLAVAQPDFQTFLGGTVNGTFPVGYVEDDLARAIGAKVRRVDISRDTVQKQMRTHPELTVAEYRLLIDSYLGARYKLPLSSIPKILVGISCAIARKKIYADAPLDEVISDDKDAMRILRDISGGISKLEVDGIESAADTTGAPVLSSSAQVFNKNTMGGF